MSRAGWRPILPISRRGFTLHGKDTVLLYDLPEDARAVMPRLLTAAGLPARID